MATGSTVDVVFAFHSAADTDTLLFNHPGVAPANPIIINNTTPIGTDVTLPTVPGQMLGFVFNDLSTLAFANGANGGPALFNGAATAAPAAPGGPANSQGYLDANPATAADGIAHTAYAMLTTGTGPADSTSASLFCDDPAIPSGGWLPTGGPMWCSVRPR